MEEFITKKKIEQNMELVLDCVMPYIQDIDDLNSVSLVSRRYFDIYSKTRKHLTVHVHYLPNPSRLGHRFPNLESLTLKSYSHGFLSANKCRTPVTPWIHEIAVKFTRLKSLSIRNMIVSASDLKLLAETRGANLWSLEIRGCKMFSEDDLIDIARYGTDLRSLRLEYNHVGYMQNGKWLHELALRNMVMESLVLGDPFTRYDMEDITHLAKKCSNSLVSLNIIPRSLSDFREVFKHAKKLNHFRCGSIYEDWDHSGFKFPSNIHGLRIDELYTASFPFLLPYLNQLRELDMQCGLFEHNCQCSLIERCPSLEVLVTDDICGDEGLQVISQFCKKLRKLTYHGRVTQMGLISLAQGCPTLEIIEVKLLDISNEALECVGTHLKNLRVFRNWWRDEDSITDTSLDNGVRAMLMGCSKLEKLYISFHPRGLTDVGLGYVGKYGRNLRYLSLRKMGESDVGLLELSKGCPKLRKLSLSNCPFSKQAVATFVFKNNHSLRYVWTEHEVLTRPMASDQMGESRKEKASEAERSRLDDFTEDNFQEVESDDETESDDEMYDMHLV